MLVTGVNPITMGYFPWLIIQPDITAVQRYYLDSIQITDRKFDIITVFKVIFGAIIITIILCKSSKLFNDALIGLTVFVILQIKKFGEKIQWEIWQFV